MMYSLIYNAAKNHSKDIINYFEENNIDLELPDEYGETPLHHAVYFGHLDLVKYLIIEKNVDVNVRDNIGSTALHRASWNGDLKILDSLTDKVDLEAVDDYGRTALHFGFDY